MEEQTPFTEERSWRACAPSWFDVGDMDDQKDHVLNVVASGYEIMCSCDHEFIELYNTRRHLQLDTLEVDEAGLWVLTCPSCRVTYHFDGGDISHAW